jgi:serine/threonine-protein kinase RsbW
MAEPKHVGRLPNNHQRQPHLLNGDTTCQVESGPSHHISINSCVLGFMNKVGAVEESEIDIEVALREALANAVIHGNHEDSHKRIYVTCRCQIDGEVSITIQDEGDGFDSREVPDPTNPPRRLLSNGRGIYLIRPLMDEVSFEEHGNVVHMRKKLRTA